MIKQLIAEAKSLSQLIECLREFHETGGYVTENEEKFLVEKILEPNILEELKCQIQRSYIANLIFLSDLAPDDSKLCNELERICINAKREKNESDEEIILVLETAQSYRT